jgi:putative endopeptidase
VQARVQHLINVTGLHPMRKLAPVFLSLCLASTGSSAQNAGLQQPLTAFPYTPSLDVSAMDKSADPCVDFYQYTCGGWMKNNPIPPDQASWNVYSKLADDNQRYLWGILESLSKPDAKRTAAQQKTGDYFASCMDSAAIEARALVPLHGYFNMIAAMKSKQDLPRLLGRLHLATQDSGLFFSFGANQDFADSSRVIAFAGAGGISLPDRDYYTKDDAQSKQIRLKYLAHMTRMFGLLGEGPDAAKRAADTVLKIETALAKASLTQVEKRDPYKLFHKVDAQGLRALTPGFAWRDYLKTVGQGGTNTFNVSDPAFYRALDKTLRDTSLADIKTYLDWHVATASAQYLSSAFVDEDFDFFSHTLHGVPQQQPRWKRCVALVDRQLGEALGQEFVSRTFSAQLKEKTLHMTQQIEQAMKEDIAHLSWMSDATKAKAQEKLAAMVNKIGYPDTWRDYSAYLVKRDDFAGNVERGNLFEARRQLAKIGKPLDRTEWGMTPPTVNAYYSAQMNDINFPAGVLQPPLYDAKLDDAPNYGNTGGTIGHELTHGFDDEGRQFDAKGNLKDWWSKDDAKAFAERSQCIVDQYAQYTIVDDIKINSRLTLGEDAADLGGLMLGWMAWKAEIATTPALAHDGLTPEQRFFVGYAQWACGNDRPEQLRVNAVVNPHSPDRYRVNGLMVNMPEFEKAFSCKRGQPMVKEQRCRVW